jgi:hypothetical protein
MRAPCFPNIVVCGLPVAEQSARPWPNGPYGDSDGALWFESEAMLSLGGVDLRDSDAHTVVDAVRGTFAKSWRVPEHCLGCNVMFDDDVNLHMSPDGKAVLTAFVYPRVSGLPLVQMPGRVTVENNKAVVRVALIECRSVQARYSAVLQREDVLELWRSMKKIGPDQWLTESLVEPLLVYARPESAATRAELSWDNESKGMVFRPTWMLGRYLELVVDARSARLWTL